MDDMDLDESSKISIKEDGRFCVNNNLNRINLRNKTADLNNIFSSQEDISVSGIQNKNLHATIDGNLYQFQHSSNNNDNVAEK